MNSATAMKLMTRLDKFSPGQVAALLIAIGVVLFVLGVAITALIVMGIFMLLNVVFPSVPAIGFWPESVIVAFVLSVLRAFLFTR